jgi:hypothetical protein
MPVTIGNLTSHVNVLDSNSMLSEPIMEQIIQRVMMRLREEIYAEEQSRQEREIRDRATTREPF